jgi:hypothetical protein
MIEIDFQYATMPSEFTAREPFMLEETLYVLVLLEASAPDNKCATKVAFPPHNYEGGEEFEGTKPTGVKE